MNQDQRIARDKKEIVVWFRGLAAYLRQIAKAQRDAVQATNKEQHDNPPVTQSGPASYKYKGKQGWVRHRNFRKMLNRC